MTCGGVSPLSRCTLSAVTIGGAEESETGMPRSWYKRSGLARSALRTADKPDSQAVAALRQAAENPSL